MFISICFDASNPMSEGLLQASSAPCDVGAKRLGQVSGRFRSGKPMGKPYRKPMGNIMVSGSWGMWIFFWSKVDRKFGVVT